jgi:putative selenium metabolism hydrolase
MRALGFDSVEIDPAGNAVGWLGDPQAGNALVIDSHVDTIPLHTPKAWTHDPFGGEVSEGRLWGLGSVDMKSAAGTSVIGVGSLAAEGFQPRRPIGVVASVAEEMMEGASLRGTLARFPTPGAVVIGEATSLQIATAQRGRAKLRVTIDGRSSHASHPERGINAVAYMAKMIVALPTVRVAPDARLGKLDLSVIDIASEPYPSVSTTPNRCLARFDCRFLPGMSKDGVIDLLTNLTRGWPPPPDGPAVSVTYEPADFRTYQGSHYVIDEYAAPWATDSNHELVRLSVSALRAAGLGGELGIYRFCTNGSLTAGELDIPTIGFGPGDQGMAHFVDESLPVEHLIGATRGYCELARVFGG